MEWKIFHFTQYNQRFHRKLNIIVVTATMHNLGIHENEDMPQDSMNYEEKKRC